MGSTVKTTTVSSSGKISKPAALKPGHNVDNFDCGSDLINSWLKDRAKKASESDTAKTFVVCRGTKRVIGFYALAAGSVERATAPRPLKQNMPDPVPVIILAMFGVDKAESGKGLGADLLNDALRRALLVAQNIGARAVLVHALDARAAKYYRDHNFRPFDEKEQTFYVTMRELRDGI